MTQASKERKGPKRIEQTGWNVQASPGSLNTTNPIREIIESMNLAENPNKKVIPLSIGDPTIFGNLKPCDEILEALNKANESGKYYGYQTAAGMDDARDAVAEYHYRNTGTRVKRQDVILASGCSHAIDLCVCVLARQGQNILIPRPGFPLYKTLTSVYGIQYKQYNLLAEKNWSVDLKHLESLIDENTAAIIINNPSNPCGSVFDKKHLIQILELAEKYKKPIIADEIYDKLVFSSASHQSDLNLNPISSSGTTISGFDGDSNRDLRNGSNSIRCNNNIIVDHNHHQHHHHHLVEHRNNQHLTSNHNYNFINGSLPTTLNTCQLNYNARNGIRYNQRKQNESHLNQHQSQLATGSYPLDQLDEPFQLELDNNEDVDDKITYLFDNDINVSMIEHLDRHIPFTALSSLTKTVPILTCGGISKTCLIPGLRLGWIIINDPQGIFEVSVRSGLNRLTQRLMGPNSLVQGALRDILTNVPESFYRNTMDFICKNAKLCYTRLQQVPGLHPHMPQGSMYLMVRFDTKLFPSIKSDLDFTSKLMNEESVVVLPGSCFDFPNYFRVCLTVPRSVMEEALDRMSNFCERHRVDMDDVVICDRNPIDNRKNCLPISARNNCAKQQIISNIDKAILRTSAHQDKMIGDIPLANHLQVMLDESLDIE